MFHELQNRIQRDVVRLLFHEALMPGQVSTTSGASRRGRKNAVAASPMQSVGGSDRNAQTAGGTKVGRNAPCPCGSGRKYKRCCGKAA